MPKELILKKLEQIKELLGELEQLLGAPLWEFKKDFRTIRAAERNFQLIVDLASDINTQILLEKSKKTPDTYKQSFIDIAKEIDFENDLSQKLVRGAGIRNILVHEYDFDEDYEKFYNSVKELIPAYAEYIKIIYDYVNLST